MTLEEVSDNYYRNRIRLDNLSTHRKDRSIDMAIKLSSYSKNFINRTENYRNYIYLKRLKANGFNGRESSFLYDISIKDLRKYDFRAYCKYNLYNSLDNFEYNDPYLNDYSKPEFSLHSLHWNDVGSVTINKAEPIIYCNYYEPMVYRSLKRR